jgi:hypothetical protein
MFCKDREGEGMKDATDATASQALRDILRQYKDVGNITGKERLLSRTLDSLRHGYGMNYPTIFAMAEQLFPGLTVSDWEDLMMVLEDWKSLF